MGSFRRRIENERGVMIPVVASFFAVLIFFLFGLAFDSGWVKRARSDAQKELEQICQQAAEELPISGAAFETFSSSINTLNANINSAVHGATLEEVRLLSPVASFPFNASPPSFTPFTSFPFGCPSGVTCTSRNDLDPSIVTNYPPQFWSTNPTNPNVDNYGSAVGCELHMEVKSLVPIVQLLGGQPKIQAKTVWRQVLRGVTNPNGGLLLGVAPHVVTPDAATPGFDRFKFYGGSFPAYDPLKGGAPVNAFTGDGGGLAAPAWINSEQWPALTQNSGAQTNQLISCANPLTVARDIVLSGIVGRAAKSSLLRVKTEIDLLGTLYDGSAFASPGPASIVPNGQDLAFDVSTGLGYYVPVVDFVEPGGQQASAVPNGPWVGGEGSLSAKLKRAYLQLTVCMQMYSGIGPNGLDLPEDPNTQNIGYEDPGVTQAIALVPQYTPFDPWPQTATNPRRAQEIVASLGTIQANPTGDLSGSDLPGLTAKEDISNPSVQETLRPDILGFMTYALTSPFGAVSHVVLVLHQPPSSSEAAGIASLILSEPPGSPPVTVIYMPYRDEDVQAPEVASAFLPTSGGAPYDGPNTILYLEPPDLDSDGFYSDQEFRDYWHDLIDSGVERNAEKIAREIWLNRITRRVLGL